MECEFVEKKDIDAFRGQAHTNIDLTQFDFKPFWPSENLTERLTQMETQGV